MNPAPYTVDQERMEEEDKAAPGNPGRKTSKEKFESTRHAGWRMSFPPASP